MMAKQTDAPLLETLARQMDCAYLSDLKYLDPRRRKKLAGLVGSLEACAVPCAEWNDALTYLGGGESCSTAEKARTALLELLGRSA